MTRYGFIGTGSMGSMLIRKFIGTGRAAPKDISASSRSGLSARALAEKTGITAECSNRAVAGNADVLFLCVKPLEIRGVIAEIRDVLKCDTLLVSIAGCVSLENLREWAGDGVHCARVIPSVTAEENGGISLVAWGHGVTPGDKTLLLGLLNAIGTAVKIDEEQFDPYTDLTSCGPALIVAMLREFIGAAVRAGTIPPDRAEFLVKETMIRTARFLAGRQDTWETIIRRVATKGGSTEEGVRVIQAGLPVVMDEVLSAMERRRHLVSNSVAALPERK